MRIATLRRVRLAYDESGTGPCVVLIHGHPFNRSLWQPQLAALQADFRVLAPDLRGFGESPVTPGTVTMREFAADIEALLDDLAIGSAAVMGLSMGGLVAMELAVTRPERYWALGLIATTAEPPGPAEGVIRRERADLTERDGMSVMVEYMHTGLYGPGCPATVRARVDAMMLATEPAGAAAALRGRAERPDYRPLLARLPLPALVCAGTADPWSDAAVTAGIVACLSDPQVALIDGPAICRTWKQRRNLTRPWASSCSLTHLAEANRRHYFSRALRTSTCGCPSRCSRSRTCRASCSPRWSCR